MVHDRLDSLAKRQFAKLKTHEIMKSLIENHYSSLTNFRIECKAPLDVLL